MTTARAPRFASQLRNGSTNFYQPVFSRIVGRISRVFSEGHLQMRRLREGHGVQLLGESVDTGILWKQNIELDLVQLLR